MFFIKQRKIPVTYGPIRLACRGECNRTDMNGIANLEAAYQLGWCDIGKVSRPFTLPPTIWWTHLGLCPDCQERW